MQLIRLRDFRPITWVVKMELVITPILSEESNAEEQREGKNTQERCGMGDDVLGGWVECVHDKIR